MRIVVLAENTTCSEQFTCEHGLSLLIETEREKILFDAGQTDLFAENAEKLGISLNDIDFAILSHGHFDHSGGMLTFLRQNQTAPLYIHREASIPHVNGAGKEEAGFGNLVVLNLNDLLEAADGLLQRYILTLKAGELLRNGEGLGEESLYLTGAAYRQLILVGKLVHTHNGNYILKLLIALKHHLHVARGAVMLLANRFGRKHS